MTASRFLFEQSVGKTLPPHIVVRHKCDNPPCINLDHLESGTRADNVADAVERGRAAKGEKQWKAKLRTEDVYFVLGSNLPRKELAAMFGVALTTIDKIKERRAWKHLLR